MKTTLSACFVAAVMLLAVGCKKEKATTPEQTPAPVKSTSQEITAGTDPTGAFTLYLYVDGQAVNEIRGIENYPRVAATGVPSSNGANTGDIYIYAFTSDQNYINFGYTIGQPFDKVVDFEAKMQAKADELGILPEDGNAEFNGTLPDEYTTYEKDLYEEYFGGQHKPSIGVLKPTVTTVAGVWKDWWGGSYNQIWGSWPADCCGWNNAISSWTLYTIYGCFIQYDRTFYRSHQITFWNWGFSKVEYYWAWWMWLDDKHSSGLVW